MFWEQIKSAILIVILFIVVLVLASIAVIFVGGIVLMAFDIKLTPEIANIAFPIISVIVTLFVMWWKMIRE